MQTRQKKYSSEELQRLGDDLFDRDIRAKVSDEDPRKYLMIDVDSGDYEVDTDDMAACDRLLARHPEAQIIGRRVGSPYTRHFGGRPWRNGE